MVNMLCTLRSQLCAATTRETKVRWKCTRAVPEERPHGAAELQPQLPPGVRAHQCCGSIAATSEVTANIAAAAAPVRRQLLLAAAAALLPAAAQHPPRASAAQRPAEAASAADIYQLRTNALQAYARRDFAEAVDNLNKLVKAAPEDPTWLEMRAQVDWPT